MAMSRHFAACFTVDTDVHVSPSPVARTGRLETVLIGTFLAQFECDVHNRDSIGNSRQNMTSVLLSMARRAKNALTGPMQRRRQREECEQRIQRLLQAGGPRVRATQQILQLKYREMMKSGDVLPCFDETELRVFSQHGEDGILLY